MKYKIYNEDAVEWARNYQKGKFHALLCDAPYHLTSIVKRFGKKNSAPAKEGTDGVFRRASSGFMGQTWDGGDLAFRPETWEAFGEVLYPGAFGMAFSASRNWHRMAVAIEDAGFILHPTIFLWAQGQGFPKATNPSKSLKKLGNRDDAEIWEGHRYGLQALKPAVEPIIIFQKPYEGRPLYNIVETGAGALNIDAARISTQGENVIINRFTNGAKPWGNAKGEEFDTVFTQQGRWPANFILDGSAERLDAQTGTLQSGKPSGKKKADNNIYGKYKNEDVDVQGFGDAGGASRFFYNVSRQLDESDPVYYCAKVSPTERNAGLDDYPVQDSWATKNKFSSDPRMEHEQNRNGVRNPHPTLKPIDLCRYLATLLLPPEEYAPRRIFIPFSGVASEMIGAMQAGWEHIVGVEFDTENDYVDIAHKRMEYWSSK
jgi:hypothetical protein